MLRVYASAVTSGQPFEATIFFLGGGGGQGKITEEEGSHKQQTSLYFRTHLLVEGEE